MGLVLTHKIIAGLPNHPGWTNEVDLVVLLNCRFTAGYDKLIVTDYRGYHALFRDLEITDRLTTHVRFRGHHNVQHRGSPDAELE